MTRGRPKSKVASESLSITLDERHLLLLDRLVAIALYGRHRNEVAASIIRFWLKDNLAQIEKQYEDLAK